MFGTALALVDGIQEGKERSSYDHCTLHRDVHIKVGHNPVAKDMSKVLK